MADTQKSESRRRHLVPYSRTSYASPYGTTQPTSVAPAASAATLHALRTHPVTPQQQHSSSTSSARRETAPAAPRPSSVVAMKNSSRGDSLSSINSARPKSPTKASTHPRSSLNAPSRAATRSSRVPTLTMSDLTAVPPRASEDAIERTATAARASATAAVPEHTTVRVGARIVRRNGSSPRPGQPTGEAPSSASSPYAASPVGTPRHLPASPVGPNGLAVYEACDLFDLHHALQHRLCEELRWSLHWYLDTETELQQLELAKELASKTEAERLVTGGVADDHPNVAVAAEGAETSFVPASSQASQPHTESCTAVTPRHSDPNTPLTYRTDAQGRQLPCKKQKSQFGVMSTRCECSLCHELAAVRRSAFAFTPRSRLSRSPYEFRLASLRRWLRKRSTESASDALLASCLSMVVQRYLAYLGFADCWTSLFVTAGLPVVQPVASLTTSPTAAREKARHFPVTLSAPTRFDRVPLSFYVLPALCRWKAMKPARVEKILRTAVVHPFPLTASFPNNAACSLEEGSADAASMATSLTFFMIQRQSYLPDRRRSSSRRNQMATLGESCVCDVYLVAAAAPHTHILSTAAETADTTSEITTVASVWGYVQDKGKGSERGEEAAGTRSLSAANRGELFYLASSLENYLRLGIIFGWVYGWQRCFSSAGPPPNSVPWLQWINASAYEAALVANAEAAP